MTELPENDASEPVTSFGENPSGLTTAQKSGAAPIHINEQSRTATSSGADPDSMVETPDSILNSAPNNGYPRSGILDPGSHEPQFTSDVQASEQVSYQAHFPTSSGADPDSIVQAPPFIPDLAPSSPEYPLFQSWSQPPARRPVRIPHFGHLLLLGLLLSIAFAVTIAAIGLAMHLHLFGWQLSMKYATDLRLNLLSEVSLYLLIFGMSLFVFPVIWHEGYFDGLEWRGAAALSKFRMLAGTASVCFGLALLDQLAMPGPENAPIEKMISTPGAAWLMFAFGVTFAPFFEEMFFRGFLLPALCTAWDWAIEQSIGKPVPPLDSSGHPQWSMSAMLVGSIATSIPFALLHVAQQGHSLGPFLLLIVISLILCAVRLRYRSLAASTMVHAMYNFLIFALTMIGTEGFRHFDKM
jgi:hypothetical protein